MKKRTVIGKAEVRAAMEQLLHWRSEREEFNQRVREEEQWYRLRMTPRRHRNSEGEEFAPTSAWLFNALMQKHADLMENIPTAVCLPREQGDEADAEALSTILPVILERTEFEGAYSDNMWYKLKHGVCAWGVFWNNELENGLGDVDLRRVELQQLYWQPGVRKLQQSSAVYYVERMDRATLRARFPRYDGKGEGGELSPFFDSGKEPSDEVLVVDWYYKKRTPEGRVVLHYCKFTGDTVLFSSENDAAFPRGWYEHGNYPFVLDVLYPIEGSCLGFGIIAIGRDPQSYIDRMDRNLLEYMDWATRVRYFCKKNTGVNEEEFCDLHRHIVEVEGDIDSERLRQIEVCAPDPLWLELKDAKIRELKETTANRDVLQGSPDTGVTAAAAIAALQESGNKTMRDMVLASYRAFVEVVRLVIECIRQFYEETRCFRILGKNGGYRYLQWSNKSIREQALGRLPNGDADTRRPVFDIDVRAEKLSPYTRYSYNEMLKELYGMGVFDAENVTAAALLLEAMSFQGVESLRARLLAAADAQKETVSGETGRKKRYETPATPDTDANLARAERNAARVREAAQKQAAL